MWKRQFPVMQRKAATAAAAAAVVVFLLCGPQLHTIRGEGKEEEWWGLLYTLGILLASSTRQRGDIYTTRIDYDRDMIAKFPCATVKTYTIMISPASHGLKDIKVAIGTLG